MSFSKSLIVFVAFAMESTTPKSSTALPVFGQGVKPSAPESKDSAASEEVSQDSAAPEVVAADNPASKPEASPKPKEDSAKEASKDSEASSAPSKDAHAVEAIIKAVEKEEKEHKKGNNAASEVEADKAADGKKTEPKAEVLGDSVPEKALKSAKAKSPQQSSNVSVNVTNKNVMNVNKQGNKVKANKSQLKGKASAASDASVIKVVKVQKPKAKPQSKVVKINHGVKVQNSILHKVIRIQKKTTTPKPQPKTVVFVDSDCVLLCSGGLTSVLSGNMLSLKQLLLSVLSRALGKEMKLAEKPTKKPEEKKSEAKPYLVAVREVSSSKTSKKVTESKETKTMKHTMFKEPEPAKLKIAAVYALRGDGDAIEKRYGAGEDVGEVAAGAFNRSLLAAAFLL